MKLRPGVRGVEYCECLNEDLGLVVGWSSEGMKKVDGINDCDLG